MIGIVVGFASQRTLGNFVAGLMIALLAAAAARRQGQGEGHRGVVEEIGLTYTFIRTPDGVTARDPEREAGLGYHRERLDQEPRRKIAEITVQVPLEPISTQAVELVEQAIPDAEVFVAALDGSATLTVRALADDEPACRTARARAAAADGARRCAPARCRRMTGAVRRALTSAWQPPQSTAAAERPRLRRASASPRQAVPREGEERRRLNGVLGLGIAVGVLVLVGLSLRRRRTRSARTARSRR